MKADDLLAAAEDALGIKCIPLPADDPLLNGADAVYDPSAASIWYNHAVGPELAAYYRTHELAHIWLRHAGRVECGVADLDGEAPEESVPIGVHRVQGYGPNERLEREANVFAREFLLPTDSLRRWFAEDGLDAAAIAEKVGIPIGLVWHQLAYATLIGDLPRVERTVAQTTELSPLDQSQKAAADADHGPVLIEAGPGTGKTRTLVGRIENLLNKGVDPTSILALTFSNKAADEMRERIARVAPDAEAHLWIGTFHAFGLDLLRKYGSFLGLPADPPILDPVDAMFLLERELPALGLSHYLYLPEPTLHVKAILTAISRAKDELKTPADYAGYGQRMRDSATTDDEIKSAEKALEVANVYKVYQGLLEKDGLLDFGDLIARSVTLLRDPSSGAKASVQATYKHVLIDEYQDVNRASAVLLQEIAGDGSGLWVVGDARQSIYRFRGAAPINMKLFTSDFPGGRVLRLSRNYRSQPPIVEAISTFAASMPDVNGTGPFIPWQADRTQTDGELQMEIAGDAAAEGEGIANEIVRHRGSGISYREQAVLCRSHTNLARIASHLGQHGIPVLYPGDLFERPEVRDLLALLSLACERDGTGLVRVARFLEYNVPLSDVLALLSMAKEQGKAFPAALELAQEAPTITIGGQAQIKLLARHLDGLCYGTEAWGMLSRYLFERSSYVRYLMQDRSVAGMQKRIAVYQFLQFAYEQRRSSHEGRHPKHGSDPKHRFLRFVRRLAVLGDDNQLRQLPTWAMDVDAVRLLTVHASKGLEFPVVYVPILATTKFPLNWTGNVCPPPPEMVGQGRDAKAEHEMEEECLFFVAISRARDFLCLSRAVQYGKVKNKVSKFLTRLDPVLPRPGGGNIPSWDFASDAEPSTEQTVAVPSPLPIYSVRALEKYIRCPRIYYYEEVLGLRGQDADTAYIQMHGCVYTVLRWILEQTNQGRAVEPGTASASLADTWAHHGPQEHPYEGLYRATAEQLVARATDQARLRRGKVAQPNWTITLPHGRVTLTPDHVEIVEEDGLTTVIVHRIRTGRPSLGEAEKEIYGLYHAAVDSEYPGAIAQVRIAYLTTGTSESVNLKPKMIESRVAKYANAMAGIANAEFKARPDEFGCPRCRSYFICPQGEES